MDILNRWTRAVIASGETVRAAAESTTDLRDADLRGADLDDADLSCADLRGADLRDANLDDADLARADLRGADLRGARLNAFVRGADLSGVIVSGVPIVAGLDAAMLAATAPEGALDMNRWHSCETTHCRAGWAIRMAGQEGAAFEKEVGPAVAGALIYYVSTGRIPDFYAADDAAMADIRRCAADPGAPPDMAVSP